MRMMKKLMTSVLCLAAAMLTFVGFHATSEAAGTKTYYLLYSANDGEFRGYDQPWDAAQPVPDFSADILDLYMNDGDNVVIYSTDLKKFDLSFQKSVGELTIVGDGNVVVGFKSFDTVYVTKNTTVVLNGDAKDVYVYDNGICNINNNVGTLHLVEDTMKKQNVNVVGTADCVSESKTGSNTTNDYYAFQKGACIITNGGMYALDGTYSRDPGAVNKPQTQTGSTSKPAAGSSDLDDVPKTGDESVSVGIYMILMSVLCATGCVVMRRKRA